MQADKMKVNKIKVSTLTGPLLNYWVAKADEKEVLIAGGTAQILHHVEQGAECYQVYSPSTDWSQGGPIIEREKMQLDPFVKSGATVRMIRPDYQLQHIEQRGETYLEAAMRCYVASKFGEEVDEI